MDEIEQLRADMAALQARLDALTEQSKPFGHDWPWVPTFRQKFWYASAASIVGEFRSEDNPTTAGFVANFNVYRTKEKAQARAELDKRLAIHAALRQLGGGDEGDWTVRHSHNNKWATINTDWPAPGEARFATKEGAQAALDVLLDRGILKHGKAK